MLGIFFFAVLLIFKKFDFNIIKIKIIIIIQQGKFYKLIF